MTRVPRAEDMSETQYALAYEVRDRIALGEENEFLRTDENWTLEDRATVADFFERHELADELRARAAGSEVAQ